MAGGSWGGEQDGGGGYVDCLSLACAAVGVGRAGCVNLSLMEVPFQVASGLPGECDLVVRASLGRGSGCMA